MMHTQDKMEKMVPSVEDEEKEEEEEESEEVEEEESEEEEEDEKEATEDEEAAGEKDGNNEKGDGGGEKDKEAKPQATDKKIPVPVQAKEKKESDVLNLNNEVVKMRKEVKRLRALIIRKLTRQIAALKKKKGKETEIERNQRRAARMLEEVHAMKSLSPDLVTKTALQKDLNFEQVCKNPKSTISDRATARIATHPQFKKKIDDIKAAVKAFREERMKGGNQGGKEKVQKQTGNKTLPSPDKRGERRSDGKEEDSAVVLKEGLDGETGGCVIKDNEHATVDKAEKEMDKETCSDDAADVQLKENLESKSTRPPSVQSSDVKDTVRNKPQRTAAEKKPSPKPAPAAPQRQTDDEESDLESDDEEKEYFDDSTEERFRQQSSLSEESDDDDFFVGKVSKFKKKKKKKVEGEEKVDNKEEIKTDVKTSDKLQRELDELESRLKSKATSLQSVFCSSLSGPKAGRGGGTGRGRGGDTFRGRGKPKGGSGVNREFSKQSKFQKQEKGTERHSVSKYSKPCPEDRSPESTEKGSASAGRGRGRGRGDTLRQKEHRGGGAFSHHAPKQALHPSWEASKKRKEQQGQILAFQGKKIKFDDDD